MPPSEPLLAAVTFDADGLCPVIAQEARTGMIRMVAWANREALALTLETGTVNEMGLTEYLVITGTARITEGGAADVLRNLAKTYIGPDAEFLPGDTPPGYLTHITVDKIGGVGPWA